MNPSSFGDLVLFFARSSGVIFSFSAHSYTSFHHPRGNAHPLSCHSACPFPAPGTHCLLSVSEFGFSGDLT